ncbi:histidine kinase dimerization/phospho-acceptor domain-containing protein [Paenibacillus chartarius]|uniref:histidine kinase n=1 Tax=Paenibacillus chartarius TaxID=747481 RepID=A0ABV6DM29_9BACL
MVNYALLTYVPGLQRENLIGRPYGVLAEACGISGADTLIMGALQGETHRSVIGEYGDRTFAVNAFPLHSLQGGISGAVSISLEITELLKLRKEIGNMERLSLVGQMAASITHEIRNPMAVIRVFIQLLQERSGTAGHPYYPIIIDELDRENAIIDDFLSLAQNRIVERKQTDINAIVRTLEPLFSAEANYRGISWNTAWTTTYRCCC